MLCFVLTEVKHLKQLVRNVVDPDRDLGHVDRDHKQNKSGSTADEKSSSVSTGQLSTGKVKDSIQQNCTTTCAANISKVSNDNEEQILPTDPDAAVAGGPAIKEDGGEDGLKDKSLGGGKACEDCK